MDFIFIEEMRVDAHVGIYAREKAAPQTLDISLTFGVPDEAARDDDIAKTIDYAVVISRVRAEGTNLVVTATVPAGIQRITLETSDRLNRAWAPRAVLRPRGESTVVTFRVPLSRPVELIRIRVDATEPVPASFFEGTNSFSAPSSQATREGFDTTTGPNGGVTPGGGSARDVVESDIWKVQGNTLYFFNQYRGLQVIDITNPDSASVRGSLVGA